MAIVYKKNQLLLVDDDPEFQKIFTSAFENIYQIDCASTIEAAEKMCEGVLYDLFLVDLHFDENLNDKRGFEFIRKLKAKKSNAPVIIISKDDQSSSVIQAYSDFSIKHYLLKRDVSFEDWSRIFQKHIIKPRLFISYSRKDKNLVSFLIDNLTLQGLDCFVDEKDISVGPVLDKIQKEIDESDYFLIVISKNSIESDWVKLELSYARDIKGKNAIIPVLLDDVKRPLAVHDLNYIDLHQPIQAIVNEITNITFAK